ncbi:hypothetical protein HOV93_02270 [Planctomycetes bacterium FF15]|uniref:Uncharacterized protein n=1 Tax=Bremerella alba TaxID=980252 RepID=A0A7V8V1T6_9BACT|nr:hypothetical protein [Bremerella alba]
MPKAFQRPIPRNALTYQGRIEIAMKTKTAQAKTKSHPLRAVRTSVRQNWPQVLPQERFQAGLIETPESVN